MSLFHKKFQLCWLSAEAWAQSRYKGGAVSPAAQSLVGFIMRHRVWLALPCWKAIWMLLDGLHLVAWQQPLISGVHFSGFVGGDGFALAQATET